MCVWVHLSQLSPLDMERNLERARLGPAARLGPQPLGVRLEPRMVSQGYHSRDSSQGKEAPLAWETIYMIGEVMRVTSTMLPDMGLKCVTQP